MATTTRWLGLSGPRNEKRVSIVFASSPANAFVSSATSPIDAAIAATRAAGSRELFRRAPIAVRFRAGSARATSEVAVASPDGHGAVGVQVVHRYSALANARPSACAGLDRDPDGAAHSGDAVLAVSAVLPVVVRTPEPARRLPARCAGVAGRGAILRM